MGNAGSVDLGRCPNVWAYGPGGAGSAADITIAKAYIDQGKGAYRNLEERKALKELLADSLSKQRSFDVIIYYSPDRLFRNVLEFETFRARLEQEHVKLICVTDPWLAATVRKNPQVAISRPTGISVS